MTQDADEAELLAVAEGLTQGARNALRALLPPGVRSLRPYHNLHDDIEFIVPATDETPELRWEGRNLDALHRADLVEAEPVEGPEVIKGGAHREVGVMEATHRWLLTLRGFEVAAAYWKDRI